MVTENAEGTRRVAEALGDLLGGGAFQEVGAKGLILALGWGGWLQETETPPLADLVNFS
jgi:hypothetical protein